MFLKKILLLAFVVLFLANFAQAEIYIYDAANIFSDSSMKETVKGCIQKYFEKTSGKMSILTLHEKNYDENKDYFSDLGLDKGKQDYNMLVMFLVDDGDITQMSVIVSFDSKISMHTIEEVLSDSQLLGDLNKESVREDALFTILTNLGETVAELEVSLITGTTIPEIMVFDRGMHSDISIVYEYSCISHSEEKSCKDLDEKWYINVEIKNLQDYSFCTIPNKDFSGGEIYIMFNTKDLFENRKYTLEIYFDDGSKYEPLLIRSFEVKFKPIGSDCKTLAEGKEEKSKIYVLGENYLDPNDFKEHLEKIMDYDREGYGIFSVEPFKSNKEKFTVYYNQYVQGKDATILTSECPHDVIIVLSDKPYRAYARMDSAKALVSIPAEKNLEDVQKTTIHEFGHAFGKLEDEYAEEGEKPYYRMPNCAPDKATAEEWWGDLEGIGKGDLKVGFFDGCGYTTNYIRPTKNSIMNDPFGISDEDWEHGYGAVSERCLLKIVNQGGVCDESDLGALKRYTSIIESQYSK